MRNSVYTALASAIVAALIMLPADLSAQARRTGSSGSSTNTTSSSSSSVRRSSSASSSSSSATRSTGSSSSSQVRRSSGSSTSSSSAVRNNSSSSTSAARPSSSASRSTTTSPSSSTQVRRSTGSTNNTSGTARSSSSSATRSTTTAPSTSTQIRRGSGTTNNSSTTRSTNESSSSQVRRSTGSGNTSTSSTGSAVRRSTTGNSGSTANQNPGTQVRRSTSGTSSGNATTQTARNVRSTNGSAQNVQNGGDNAAVRSNTNVTRRGLTTITDDMKNNTQSAPNAAPGGNMAPRYDDFRINNHNVERIHPRERDYIPYTRPGHFYGPDPHYFGFRIHSLPPRYRKVHYYGFDYYVFNDIYYRPYRGYYVICRPPVGVIIANAIRDAVFAPVRFAYYHSVYRTYSGWDSYSRYIDQQNRIIAENNALIARQNSMLAMNTTSAQSSYEIANRLGLAQSYAYANQEYYYDDGVFYILNAKGRYEVIVPPAGALVDELPEDYDTLTLGGTELYRVDDTVYRVVMVSGRPCLEVLGQMYGDMARRYNVLYN